MKNRDYEYWKDENGVSEFPLAVQQKFIIIQEEDALKTYGKRDGNMNAGQACRMQLKVDVKRLEEVIQRVVDENDALRLIFLKKEEQYLQKVVIGYKVPLDFFDYTTESEEERYNLALRKATELLNEEIDYYNEIGVRFGLIKLAEEDYLFVCIAHHWIGDGSTLALIMGRIFEYYMNPMAKADEETASFIDFVKYEYEFVDSERGQKQLKYWKDELVGYQQLDLAKAGEGSPATTADMFALIDKKNLREAAVKYTTSEFNVMLLAYHIAISKILEINDTIIGFSCANRLKKKYLKTIGYLSRAVQHRLVINDTDKLSELLRISVEKTAQNITNQQTSHYNDSSQFYISYQNFVAGNNKDSSNDKITQVQIPVKRVLNFFTMLVFDKEDELSLVMAGNEEMFSSTFITKLKKYINCAIELLNTEEQATVSDVQKLYDLSE